jgi:hypothetical protein
MYDNRAACSYLEDSTSCAFRLRTTRQSYGTEGRVSINSTASPGESPLVASPSVSLSRGLQPSVDSLPGSALATRALLASAAALGRKWSDRGMSGCGGYLRYNSVCPYRRSSVSSGRTEFVFNIK